MPPVVWVVERVQREVVEAPALEDFLTARHPHARHLEWVQSRVRPDLDERMAEAGLLAFERYRASKMSS